MVQSQNDLPYEFGTFHGVLMDVGYAQVAGVDTRGTLRRPSRIRVSVRVRVSWIRYERYSAAS